MIGFLNVYKPENLSSSKVVSSIKKRFKIDKIGHMGTLDPLAKGVLPIAIGRATRMFDYFLNKTKTYVAHFTFGKTTTTLDREGEITETCDFLPDLTTIQKVLPKFLGTISQLPPEYSAKKVNGECAYSLARKNIQFELKPKDVFIEKFVVTRQISPDTFEFEITCGSGTYIRSLARDLAEAVGTKGYMSSLERISSGVFLKEDAITLDDLLKLGDLLDLLVPIEKVFDKMGKIALDNRSIKRLLDGQKMDCNLTDGYYLVFGEELECVGEVIDKKLKLKTYLKG